MVDVKSLKGLTHDSRRVKDGYLFAALPGSKTDGSEYIDDAIRHGATAILAPECTNAPSGTHIDFITDENPRLAFAKMVAEFYGRQPETVVAVTGTNGKTSVVHFARQLWESQEIKAGSLGTLGINAPGMVRAGKMTTPDPVSLHAELADLAAVGVTHLALEASSHGLDQYRLDGVRIKAGGFTNISHDHLDYHGDMDSYRTSKRRLFEIVGEGGTAVLNADSDEFEKLVQCVQNEGQQIISYGRAGEDLKIKNITPTPQGQEIQIKVFGEAYDLTLPLVGEFQVYNSLCALGLVLAEDQGKAQDYVSVLERLHGAPGRLELVPDHPKGAVYVDYAHTPDALENVLKALQPHTKGKLICLFGCGGERDAKKRPVMGKIAHDLANHVIVTDDNPRGEVPEKIRASILEEAPDAQEIPDRHEAIQAAVQNLSEGDVLVIAGKGHEQGQVFADQAMPFDDCEEAAKAIGDLS